MSQLLERFEVKETKTSIFVLEKRQGTQSIIWVMFCERDGKELKGTRESRLRLDKETKEFFKVK